MKQPGDLFYDKDDEETGQQGGAAGKIEFRYHETMSVGPRDDQLPPSEMNRLMQVLGDLHEQRVRDQRIKRRERAALKNQSPSLSQSSGHGYRGGSGGLHQQHPVLGKKPQFSGSTDPQTNPNPNNNAAETNQEMNQKLQLQNQLRNQLRHQPAPKYTAPTPRPR